MNATRQDTIEKQVLVKASRERVFAAISDPEQIVNWFPEKVEGAFKVGEDAVLDFGKNWRFRVRIVASDRPSYFAYRWAPHSEQGAETEPLKEPTTIVEFWLDDSPEGTVVRLKESGFASLPAEVSAKQFEDNNGGWDTELGRLVKLFE